MAKKMKVSLSLKLTLIVVSVSAVIIFSTTYFNFQSQTSFFTKNYAEKAHMLVKSIDASIGFHGDYSNNQTLQRYVENVSKANTEIIQLSISIPAADGFRIIASSNRSLIGALSGTYNNISYERNMLVYFPVDVGDSHLVTVVAPMNISGQITGTYEILFSMDRTYVAFDAQMRNLIAMSVVSLFVLIFMSMYLLRKAIVNPIIKFRDAAQLIGKGELDEEIQIVSHDELGELADAFNQMSSDLKKSRLKIESYNSTLADLLNQKDEFITQLGHDLKNPLMQLVGLPPLVLSKVEDPQIQTHLKIIIRNAEYMKDLILKTLKLAKLRSQSTDFEYETFNLSEMVEEILESQQHLLKENNMIVHDNVPKDYFVHADKLWLIELVNNLLTNAIKYTPDGGGSISIDATRDERYITVLVRDTGVGMTRQQVDQVFDEFYKAAQSRKGFDSSGLGLSICRRIVERHGGTIWVESEGPNKGSTFFFTIPTSNKK